MIRYRQLTDAELAERDKPQLDSAKPKSKRLKLSAVKKQHHARQTEKPPRRIAGRHAAKRTP